MSDYTSWHIGMKVVCVDADPSMGYRILELGRVYTVASIGYASGIFKEQRVSDEVVVTLEEAQSVRRDGTPHKNGFAARRFRPVQTRKTDISIFTAMLTDAKTKVPA